MGIQRYPDERWVKFIYEAETYKGQKTGKQKQYCKLITGMLKQYGLNRESMQNRDEWRQKLHELFPRCTNVPEEAEKGELTTGKDEEEEPTPAETCPKEEN